MTRDEIKKHAADLREEAGRIVSEGISAAGLHARVIEFFSIAGGKRNAFVESARDIPRAVNDFSRASRLESLLAGFIAFVDSGMAASVTPERQAELDVVSDFLEQAHLLLESTKVHPAAPIVLIGATLEEFLRTWVEAENLSIGNAKPGLDAYSKVLREAELITKQDSKELASWGGLRNHAAHGEWEEVKDPQRARIMLEGVNLFMRKYSPAQG